MDRESFLDKTCKAILSLLSGFARVKSPTKKKSFSVGLALGETLLSILFLSLSQNYAYSLFVFTVLLLLIALQDGQTIRAIFACLLPAEATAFLILLPAALLGQTATLLFVCTKLFSTISMLTLLRLFTQKQELTAALKIFHLPDLLLFTFDLTVCYIRILGELAAQLLIALRLRSIGKNRKKRQSLAGILGTLYLRSVELSKETQKAMECRGFNGQYPKRKLSSPTRSDLPGLLLFLLLVGGFFYFEILV
jgi:cobalt/nickel transport system permease protein